MEQYTIGNEAYARSDWIEFSQCCENHYYLPKLLIINLAADNTRGTYYADEHFTLFSL